MTTIGQPKKRVSSRQDYNLEIVSRLEEFFTSDENKDLRFIQGLWALGIVNAEGEDKFYEESIKTLAKVEKKLKGDLPCSEEELLDRIREKCEEAIRAYSRNEFFEDDCDLFLGESNMAETILDIVNGYELMKGVLKDDKDKEIK